MSDMPLSPLAGLDAASLLQGTPAGTRPSSNTPANIHRAAVQFESVLLGQWLESAEKSFATVPGSEDSDDAGSEQMMSFGMQQFAAAMAKSGGLGIARVVERGLVASAASSSAAGSAALASSPRQPLAAPPVSVAPASALPLAPASPAPAEKTPYAYTFPLPY